MSSASSDKHTQTPLASGGNELLEPLLRLLVALVRHVARGKRREEKRRGALSVVVLVVVVV